MFRIPTFLILIAVMAMETTGLALAQRSGAPKSDQLRVVAVVGCVTADGDAWVLTNASGPLAVPTADGKAETGSGVTFEKAKAEPPGKERYRLMNMLTEFGVAQHKGQRVLVKGLLLGDAKDRRLNLVAFEPVALTCNGASR